MIQKLLHSTLETNNSSPAVGGGGAKQLFIDLLIERRLSLALQDQIFFSTHTDRTAAAYKHTMARRYDARTTIFSPEGNHPNTNWSTTSFRPHQYNWLENEYSSLFPVWITKKFKF